MSKKIKDIKTTTENIIDEQDNLQFSNDHEQKSDLIRAMELLHSPENIEGNTILDNKQVNALTLMNWASQVYDIEFFKHYVALFPRYRISGDDGRGRKEQIKIAEAIRLEQLNKENKYLDFLSRR